MNENQENSYAVFINDDQAVTHSPGMLGLKYVCFFTEKVAHEVAKYENQSSYYLMPKTEFNKRYQGLYSKFVESLTAWENL